MAAEEGHKETVDYLIEHGADLNIKDHKQVNVSCLVQTHHIHQNVIIHVVSFSILNGNKPQ